MTSAAAIDTVTSAPQIEGKREPWGDSRYRIYTHEHISFDALPSYRDGGPATVVVDGYSMSTSSVSGFSSRSVLAADDGMHTLSLSKPIRGDECEITRFDKHPLDGTKYAIERDAKRAAFDAGALAFMVYERDAAKWGLPTE
jgi:hypothetical protein